MRLRGERHLTYCTNIHPGESWADVRGNLERYVLPVRERVASGERFGLGLRLSARAAVELARPGELDELRSFLDDHDLYVFTINGFPHGAFHGRPVKERVYLPDWLDDARLDYTNRLADLLAALLPDGVEGTISTVPGAFAPRVNGREDAARMAERMARHVHHLLRLREATGQRVALALEPEPCCHLETIDQAAAFFEDHLLNAPGVDTLASGSGLSRAAAEAALREHVGLCFDTCHMAVEYEDPGAALSRIEGAGIRLVKTQVSAGLQAMIPGEGAAARQALESFAEDVYLHQVVERTAGGELRRYLDLPDALAAAAREPELAREWRIHFHVPLFHARMGLFGSTQDYARESLELIRARTECKHFEVETYTWGVLPEEYRAAGVVDAVARELEWAAAHLEGAPVGASGS